MSTARVSAPTQPAHITVVVVAWNNWDLTRQCLTSVQDAAYSSRDVILVDNGSSDATQQKAANEFPNVRVERLTANAGFAGGANRGLRRAMASQRTQYILLLNNDTRVPADLLQALVAEAERDARIGVVTCRVDLADPHGRIWSIGSRKNRWLAPIDFAPWPIDSRLAATAHDVDYVLGAVMLVRVAALRAVGLFDERYFFYYEDLDLSLRLASAGYRLRYVPLPVVLHAGAATSGRETALSEYHQGRSSVVFYATHGRGARLAFGIYRVGSAVGRVARLCARGHWRETGAYLRGTRDGLRTLREHPRPVIA